MEGGREEEGWCEWAIVIFGCSLLETGRGGGSV